jgi:phage recombination protein Bet
MVVPAPGAEPGLLERLTALRQTLAPNLNDGELELFALVAQQKGLDPFSGQIRAVKRNTNRGAVVTYQTGIDGYRSIAERTGQYRGSDEPVFGPECSCGKEPKGHPEWARVIVHRRLGSDDYIHQAGKAKWHEYIPSEDFMWKEKPEVMLGKTAEAKALRIAFPWVLGNIYIPEEMARADDEAAAPKQIVSAREAVAARAAEIRAEDGPDRRVREEPAPLGQDRRHPAAGGGSEDEGEESTDADGRGHPEGDTAPAPGASEPPLAADEEIDANEFKRRLEAAGLTPQAAAAKSAELFPTRTAASLSKAEWGQLWAAIQADLWADEARAQG